MNKKHFLYYLLTTIAILISPPSNAQAGDKTPVITAVAEQISFSDTIEALGTLKANESVNITATVSELISDISFKEGQRVKKGDVLINMDTSDESALLNEEQARLRNAQRQVERLKPLAAQNATSKSALDTETSAVEISQAKIEGIQSQIDKRQITAPFDGLIGLRNISVGTLAQPGNLLATIDDDGLMKMDFSVPERFLAELHSGLNISATAKAFPDKTFNGEITSIDSRVNPTTRSVVVRAIVNNDDRLLRPGILMKIILSTKPRQALMIPEEAITSVGNIHHVFVVTTEQSESLIKQQTVTIGTRTKGKSEITSGLNPNDQVVIHGTLRVKNGTPVEVIAVKKGDETLEQLLQQHKG